MQFSKFQDMLERVHNELLDARMSFNIWLDLSFGTDDIESILNAYKGFFAISRQGLLDRCFIKIGNVTDPTRKKAPSFYNLLRLLAPPDSNAGGFHIKNCREKLKTQREIERKVRRYRDKKAAHSEIDAHLEPLQVEEMEALLDNLEAVFQDIYGFANPGERYSFKVLQHADTHKLLKDLTRHWDVVPKAEVVAWAALKNNSDLATYLVPSREVEQLMDAVGRPHGGTERQPDS